MEKEKIIKSCSSCFITNNYYAKGLCRKCYNKKYSKKYYNNNKQKFLDAASKRYKEHKSECLQAMKNYAEKHKEERKKYNANYYQKNYFKMRDGMKKYYEENKHELWLKQKEKIANDPVLRLERLLRERIRAAIMANCKQTSTKTLLGANIQIVREHLQKQFRPGMTWKNHKKNVWHIDHIIPCNNFDLTKLEEQQKCFHYTNLQPLWSFENCSKQNRDFPVDIQIAQAMCFLF